MSNIYFFTIFAKNIANMTIRDVEIKLQELRKELGVTYTWLEDRGLSQNSVIKILHGDNYRISTLFKYIENLYCVLVVDGVLVGNPEALGAVLRSKRISMGYNSIQIQSKLTWPMRQVLAIEKGRGYYKNSLLTYLEVVPADFDLKSLADLTDEERINLLGN